MVRLLVLTTLLITLLGCDKKGVQEGNHGKPKAQISGAESVDTGILTGFCVARLLIVLAGRLSANALF